MKDLFEPKKPTPKQGLSGKMLDLALWMGRYQFTKTSDAAMWGVDHYYVSAVRAACILAERGYLRRATEEEIVQRYGKPLGQGVWIPTAKLEELCSR